jgi:2-desacetyl-2-hydroxyethyl bacteriochlorophyllide A dehydrogenase
MKAIVKTHRTSGIEVLEMPRPEIGPTDILVRVAAGSLCGSDVHIYEWTPSYFFMSLPIILGHEFSGQVVQVGSEVTHVQVGDRVSALPSMPCGSCANCRTGRSSACTRRLSPGMMTDGFFAEYGRLTTAAEIFKLPEEVSYEAAALLEPFAVSLNAVDISGFKLGQKTAILGPGPIGLFTLQVLRAAGAARIMMVGAEGDARRLEMAERLGADLSVNITHENPVKRVKAISPNGLDIVYEATGNPKSIAQALDMVRRGGKVILIGIHSGPATFDPTPLVRSSKSIIGAYAYTVETWQRAIELLANRRVDPEAVISHRLPLEAADKGFQLALKKEAVKVLFIP